MRKLFLISLLLPTCLLATPAQAKTCQDFATQQEAQAYMERTQDGSLDRDNDGLACETLPSAPARSVAPAPVPRSAPPAAKPQPETAYRRYVRIALAAVDKGDFDTAIVNYRRAQNATTDDCDWQFLEYSISAALQAKADKDPSEFERHLNGLLSMNTQCQYP